MARNENSLLCESVMSAKMKPPKKPMSVEKNVNLMVIHTAEAKSGRYGSNTEKSSITYSFKIKPGRGSRCRVLVYFAISSLATASSYCLVAVSPRCLTKILCISPLACISFKMPSTVATSLEPFGRAMAKVSA